MWTDSFAGTGDVVTNIVLHVLQVCVGRKHKYIARIVLSNLEIVKIRKCSLD